MKSDDKKEHTEGTVKTVWVFVGDKKSFPSAVFSSRQLAEEWIITNALTGTLTAYPLDSGVYDWAVGNGFFHPVKQHHKTSSFIQNFSSAYLEHYHYENGRP